MYRGTTPTITFTLPDTVDLSNAENIYIRFSKANRVPIFTKEDEDMVINQNVIGLYLTQEETLRLDRDNLVQVNWTYRDGRKLKRACSVVAQLRAKDNLMNEVIE